MHDTVIVPLDGSRFGEHALGTAAMLARRTGARIELLHVYHVNVYTFDLDVEAEGRVKEEGRIYLEGVRDRLEHEMGLNATATWLEGLPAQEITERARAAGDPIVVMSTHGRTGLSRSWLGSVTDEVVRRSTVPVLAVRPPEEDTGEDFLRQGRTIHRILVPLDGSDTAAAILPDAGWLAAAMTAEIVLLRVVEPVYAPVPAVPVPYAPSPLMWETLETLVDRSKGYLEEAARELRRSYPDLVVDSEVQVGDSPARTIIERARARKADAVAIATHGRRASRIVVHSVADKVLRAGPPVVLIMHAKNE